MKPEPGGGVLAATTHRYCDHQATTDCANKCGAWMGPSRSGAPDGVDPFGACKWPNNGSACKACKRIPQPYGAPSLPSDLEQPIIALPGTSVGACKSCRKVSTHHADVGIEMRIGRPCNECMLHGPPPCPAWDDGEHMFNFATVDSQPAKRCACGFFVPWIKP